MTVETDRQTADRARDSRADEVLLSTEDLVVGYSGVPVVSGVDLTLKRGEIVALLGRNGAGKTTLLHTLAGLVPVISGTVTILGHRPPSGLHRRVRNGMRLVTEERAIIRRLSVLDNLRLGDGLVDGAFERFPELAPLRNRKAGLLSGGEQQMLVLAKSLAARPDILLIDELSLGLAPLIVDRLLSEVRKAAREDQAGIILVEQQSVTALEIATRACVIASGEVKLSGDAAELRGRREEIEALYLSG
jgi:branched-chain amino acid transport system ATP-binding protein